MNNDKQNDSSDDLLDWFDIDYSKTNIYENWPAGDFTEHKLKYYPNIKYRKYFNDPPDFYLTLNNEIYNLEVKSIVDPKIHKANQFLLLNVEKINKYIDVIKINLPKTKILAYIYPGDQYVELDYGSKISVPDFSNQLGKTKLDHYIEISINKYIKDFTSDDVSELPIENEKGEVVVKLNKMTQNNDTEIFELSLFPNYCNIGFNYWNNHNITEYLQAIISKAEEKYIDFNDNNFKWWLLMCDPENSMLLRNHSELIINSSFNFKLFEKVFLTIEQGSLLKAYKLNKA